MELTYSQARSSICNGDIVFFYSRGLFHHNLISFFTLSTVIHVGIAFWIEVGNHSQLMIAEANGGYSRRIINMSSYKGYDMDIIRCPIICNGIEDRIGGKFGDVKYSWLEAGYVGIRELIAHKFNIMLPNIKLNGEICSEFVCNILDIPYAHYSPASLYSLLVQEHSGVVQYKIRNKKGA